MRNSLHLIVILLILTSCVKYKNLVYLDGPSEDFYKSYTVSDYQIKPYDILSIELNSLEQNTSRYFDESFSEQGNRGGGGGNQAGPMLYLSGYIVDSAGYVDLPLLNRVEVGGLTTKEIKEKIDTALTEYMKFASVSVKLVNFRVTVFGEVGAPGVQYIYEQKYTLLQALSNAGNPTPYGNTEKIKILRESANGTEVSFIDITDPNILNSDFYFMQPNDVIYVEPIRARSFALNSRISGLALSVIGVGLTIITIVLNFNR